MDALVPVTGRTNPERQISREDELTFRMVRGKNGIASGTCIRAAPKALAGMPACTFSYQVYFPKDFRWVKGGKLPGVGLGIPGTNSKSATGGAWDPRAGSCRVMWREGGRAVGYLYLPARDGRAAFKKQSEAYKSVTEIKGGSGHEVWGDGPLRFRAGEWNDVTVKISLGDGTFSLRVNDVVRRIDVDYMNDRVRCTEALVAAFFGGSDAAWNSPVDTFVKFRNFSFGKVE